jgi:hypothetical protein
MVKFTAAGNGVTLIGLGLEPGNITRLQQGQTLRVRLSELGFTGAAGSIHIMIFAGESAEAMQKTLQPFISEDTVIHRG